MQITIIASLKYFDFQQHDTGAKINSFRIFIGAYFLNELINNDIFLDGIGKMNQRILSSSQCVFFNGESHTLPNSNSNDNQFEITRKVHGQLQVLFSNFWFIKDNSVSVGDMFSLNKEQFTLKATNYSLISNASGENEITSFSDDDIKKMLDVYQKINSFRKLSLEKDLQHNYIANPIRVPDFNYIPYNSINRINRALNFLHLARTNSFLPLKISFYIAMYECLFTTDNSEVTHKVTERATFYLGGDKSKKLHNFDLIKNAYGIRSKYVHGQELEKKFSKREDLLDISIRIDNLTRELMTKIIYNDVDQFLKDNQALNLWFKELILS